MTQVFPEGASATSAYLQWAEIPVTEQGGGLEYYEISYWVVGPPGQINKVYQRIGQPASKDGFSTHEIQHLRINLEYKVAVYGKRQYSANVLDQSYFSTEISFRLSAGRTYLKLILFKSCKGSIVLRFIFKVDTRAVKVV